MFLALVLFSRVLSSVVGSRYVSESSVATLQLTGDVEADFGQRPGVIVVEDPGKYFFEKFMCVIVCDCVCNCIIFCFFGIVCVLNKATNSFDLFPL